MFGMGLETGTPMIATHKILNRGQDLPSDQRKLRAACRDLNHRHE